MKRILLVLAMFVAMVAGAQIGNFLIGVDVAARRAFDDGATTVTASLELSALLPLVPVFAAMWSGGS
jgi:hypothetical protein